MTNREGRLGWLEQWAEGERRRQNKKPEILVEDPEGNCYDMAAFNMFDRLEAVDLASYGPEDKCVRIVADRPLTAILADRRVREAEVAAYMAAHPEAAELPPDTSS